MSRLGFRKVRLYGADGVCLGVLDMVPVVGGENFQFPNNEIRLNRFSAVSERVAPLAVLQTISASVRFKLVRVCSKSTDRSKLINLQSSCSNERKTAMVIINNEELHLVAMPPRNPNKSPCFWCYSVPVGLYQSCLEMLNLRCLGIVFDLDETLVVANTMKSFEERIEGLKSQIALESDPNRSSGMASEMNRYIEDWSLLKQYAESDSVVESGEVHKAKPEFTTQERGFRPVIRLLEKNLVLTRIIPENRDTSVLVRIRPGWEDLKSYLITNDGRKRFEVYVCTMAQKEYALETWRLLDPDATLISIDQRMNRIVSVKHTAKKSLLHVFQGGVCHPKMAMVVDDRVNVWEDVDQPCVHAVPAFTPHYAPRAETEAAVPVLHMVRNVVCDVRGRFFKEFDESLLHKISELRCEDDAASFLASPDVRNYLLSIKDASFVPNGSEAVPNTFKNPGLAGSAVIPNAFKNPGLAGSEAVPNAFKNPGLAGSEVVPNAFKNPSLVGSEVVPNASKTPCLAGSEVVPNASKTPYLAGSEVVPNAFENPSLAGSQNQLPATINEHQTGEAPKGIPPVAIYALNLIGRNCNSKVEFKRVTRTSNSDLEFSFEAWFDGEMLGFGTGNAMEDAQLQAADKALRALTGKLSHNQQESLYKMCTEKTERFSQRKCVQRKHRLRSLISRRLAVVPNLTSSM